MNNTTLKPLLIITLAIGLFCTQNATAQKKSNASSSETYGNVLNVGIGLDFLISAPILHANYEFDIAKNFTLAPYVNVPSYLSFLQFGAKGTYYFDDLIELNKNWDLFLGASAGLTFPYHNWDNKILSLHVGSEYHINDRIGVYLDLSRFSTIGIAIRPSR